MIGGGGEVRRMVVISPHLDDAVFSLGATIRRTIRTGTDVDIVTVMAGDPASESPAGSWDRRGGFATAGQAARARREDDRRACELLGAHPRWLAFTDRQYGADIDEDEAWESLAPLLASAERILLPGFPLTNPDHRWTADLVLRRVPPDLPVALYAEQPYATWEGRHREPAREPIPGVGAGPWRPIPTSLGERVTKLQACRCYRSQFRTIHRRPAWLAIKVWRYERVHGGELVAPVSSVNRHR